jgi:hypothetical protein
MTGLSKLVAPHLAKLLHFTHHPAINTTRNAGKCHNHVDMTFAFVVAPLRHEQVVAEAAAGGHCGRLTYDLLFRLRDTHGLDRLAAPAITSGYGAPMCRAAMGASKKVHIIR